jgi:hypothetical protein
MIATRAQSPRIKRMMGRIASLLLVVPRPGHPHLRPVRKRSQAARFLTENYYISRVNKREGWK